MKTFRVHHSTRPGLAPLMASLLALVVLGRAALLCAQPATSPLEPPAHRYLIIVDTSRAMQGRERAVLKTVEELLKSRMGGQMRAGDTLGVWTFDTELYAGRLPLQHWSPAQHKAITARVLAFLKGQRFEKFPVLDNVLPPMDGLVRNSQLITVILITSGVGLMQGTPFDHQINEFWQRWLDKQKAAKMPFVVVLRAREGAMKDYMLNLPPRPVQMPLLPAESPTAVAPPQPVAHQPPPKPQPPAAQPLIISGRKPKPLQPPKTEEDPTARPRPSANVVTNEPPSKQTPPVSLAPVPKVEAANVEPAPVKLIVPVPESAPASNAPPAGKADLPKPLPPVTETVKAEPKLTVPPMPAPPPPPAQTTLAAQPTAPPPTPAPKAEALNAPAEKAAAAAPIQPPAPLPPTTPKVEPTGAPQPKPVQPAPVQVATAPLPPPPATPSATAIEAPKLAFGPKPTFEAGVTPAPANLAQHAVSAVAPSAQTVTAPSTTIPRPQQSASPPSASVGAAGTAKANPANEKKPDLAAAPSSSREVAAAPSTRGTNAPSDIAFAHLGPDGLPASPAVPVQAAVATPAEGFLSQKTTWVAAFLLLTAAFGFGWLALRRSRATAHASLITRSLDRGKKR